MGEDPREIREEIEDSRERMGETIEAIGYKADVKTRTKEKVSEKVEAVKSKVGGAGTRVNEATPGREDVKQGAGQAVGLAQENRSAWRSARSPSDSWLACSSRPRGRRTRSSAKSPIRSPTRSRRPSRRPASAARRSCSRPPKAPRETAQESGQHHAEELKQSAQQSAQETKEQAGS